MNTQSKKTLIAPLITPLLNGKVDETSLIKLIHSLHGYADILVPCLSSGEGSKLSESQWQEVVRIVTTYAKVPVYAGMLRSKTEMTSSIQTAHALGCAGIVIPLGNYNENEVHALIALAKEHTLNIIFYNTESQAVKDISYILRLAKHDNVVGFKDSTMDSVFLKQLVGATRNTQMRVYQGMEMGIALDALEVDGFFISLANVEPELCSELTKNNPEFDWKRFQNIVQKYNLASDRWYVTLKALLYARGSIRSTEEVHTIL
jgi:4-hydroxy-tetrahydrodipicolinate synthase